MSEMPAVCLGIVSIVLAAGLAFAVRKIIHAREDRKMRGILCSWPIPQTDPEAFDSCFRTGTLGPERSTEIRFIANFKVEGGISDLESWILCNLAKKAARIFEIGTCTGKTAYLLAANAQPQARIFTLTLRPEDAGQYTAAAGDAPDARASAAMESRFSTFFYNGTSEEGKIQQLFGDSKNFDETPYLNSCDLIFVDGSHARSYVESDSQKALRMVKPGGVVLWHDYRGPRQTRGVFDALNALGQNIPLAHIKGTSLVAYRRPLS
ncbi:MAG: class I SAM-dependent methyltransferase [Alphaproteobacteria bacterium]|nr:class I SAM-dependent methyltransferase [Alphaproteobacteria bacterium]